MSNWLDYSTIRKTKLDIPEIFTPFDVGIDNENYAIMPNENHPAVGKVTHWIKPKQDCFVSIELFRSKKEIVVDA